MRIIERSRQAHRVSDVIAMLEDCLDGHFASRVLAFLRREGSTPEEFGALLAWLLRHGIRDARDFAESLVEPPRFSTDRWPRLSCEAAIALLAWTDDAAWDVIWPVISRYTELGRQAFQRIAHDFDWRSIDVASRLTEGQLTQLADWLLTHYPPANDPHYEGVYCVGPDDSVRRWRDALLNHLRDCGTAAACAVIGDLRDRHPECPWLGNVYLEAQRARRRESWAPPSPRELLGLSRDAACRVIVSPSQLLDLIVESLDRYAEELHGTTPSVTNLWNGPSDGRWRPKDENHFSDNVKRHLEVDLCRRGIVVNREVEIRRRTGVDGEPGQRTDVHVNAISRGEGSDAASVLTVIIEVKGCWHREVRGAMQSQLVDRYLRENQCQHGLYLVGWFRCSQWDGSDSRMASTPWATLADARNELDSQASASSGATDVRAYVIDCSLR